MGSKTHDQGVCDKLLKASKAFRAIWVKSCCFHRKKQEQTTKRLPSRSPDNRPSRHRPGTLSERRRQACTGRLGSCRLNPFWTQRGNHRSQRCPIVRDPTIHQTDPLASTIEHPRLLHEPSRCRIGLERHHPPSTCRCQGGEPTDFHADVNDKGILRKPVAEGPLN